MKPKKKKFMAQNMRGILNRTMISSYCYYYISGPLISQALKQSFAVPSCWRGSNLIFVRGK
jgi:hypothetical protein